MKLDTELGGAAVKDGSKGGFLVLKN